MYYLGIDVGGTGIKGAVTDENGNILAKASIPTRKSDTLAEDVSVLADILFERCSLKKSDITALGLGIPGMIDSAAGLIKYSNNLKAENLNIVSELRKYFDMPIYIANDADAAALGEARFGSGKGKSNIVFVTLGTGVGTGIIVKGKLLEGSEGGHICIDYNGSECTCTCRGCWEAYASVTALKKMTTEAAEKNPESMLANAIKKDGVSGKTAFQCAKAGDEVGMAVVDGYLEYIAIGLGALSNIFNPDCILLGGGLSNEDPKYFAVLENKMREHLFAKDHKGRIEVKAAILKNDAGVLGAVSLAMC